MANELKHGSVGTELTQAEWEAVGAHVLESQATGDIVYAESASQLRRLGIGSNTDVLTLAAGVPSWAAPAAAAAGSLTGSTLASGVTASSLTSVGTVTSGVWNAGAVTSSGAVTGASLVADETTINSNTISVSSANLTLDPDNDIVFSPSGISQNYGMSDRGHGLTLQSLTSGSDFRWELFTADGDATDGISLYLYAKGTPAQMSNLERGLWYYDTGNTQFFFGTDASGTGTTRDLRIGVPAGKDVILGDNVAVLTVKGNSTIQEHAMSGTAGVVRASIYKTGIADNSATNIFTITSTNESGDADDGAYTVIMSGVIGHRINTDTGAHAMKAFQYAFGRTIRGDGTGVNTAVTEIYESAVAASASGTRSIGTVTMTVVETSEYVQTVAIQIDLTGSSVSTAEFMVNVELNWAEFATVPVIAAS